MGRWCSTHLAGHHTSFTAVSPRKDEIPARVGLKIHYFYGNASESRQAFRRRSSWNGAPSRRVREDAISRILGYVSAVSDKRFNASPVTRAGIQDLPISAPRLS